MSFRKWKSTEEALPHVGIDVLGWFPDFDRVWPVYIDEEKGGWKRFGGDETRPPVAWRHFPNPPEFISRKRRP